MPSDGERIGGGVEFARVLQRRQHLRFVVAKTSQSDALGIRVHAGVADHGQHGCDVLPLLIECNRLGCGVHHPVTLYRPDRRRITACGIERDALCIRVHRYIADDGASGGGVGAGPGEEHALHRWRQAGVGIDRLQRHRVVLRLFGDEVSKLGRDALRIGHEGDDLRYIENRLDAKHIKVAGGGGGILGARLDQCQELDVFVKVLDRSEPAQLTLDLRHQIDLGRAACPHVLPGLDVIPSALRDALIGIRVPGPRAGQIFQIGGAGGIERAGGAGCAQAAQEVVNALPLAHQRAQGIAHARNHLLLRASHVLGGSGGILLRLGGVLIGFGQVLGGINLLLQRFQRGVQRLQFILALGGERAGCIALRFHQLDFKTALLRGERCEPRVFGRLSLDGCRGDARKRLRQRFAVRLQAANVRHQAFGDRVAGGEQRGLQVLLHAVARRAHVDGERGERVHRQAGRLGLRLHTVKHLLDGVVEPGQILRRQRLPYRTRPQIGRARPRCSPLLARKAAARDGAV